MDLPQRDDYLTLFADDLPLLDVRAPAEFLQGAFPFASNLPLINDEERRRIGVCYKQMGQTKAVELGHELVSGDIRAARIDAWAEFVRQNPHGAIYCFRGGMRSKISQRWIFETTGVVYPRVKGGYKALRRFLLGELDAAAREMRAVVLSGRTGVGKTELLRRVDHHVDLEAIYKHRGSAFGKYIVPQPSQIDAENTLSIALLKLKKSGARNWVLEDESANIGSRRLPECIVQAMKSSPIVVLEAGMDERVENVFREYVVAALREYQAMSGEVAGFDAWAENLRGALAKIQKRLGGLRYKAIADALNQAIQTQQSAGSLDRHRVWIRSLLADYYDPMYDYQLAAKRDRVVFRGVYAAVLDFLRETPLAWPLAGSSWRA